MLILPPVWADGLADIARALPQEKLTSTDAVEKLRVAAQRNGLLQGIVGMAAKVLEEQCFVQLRGLPREHALVLFPAIGSLLGTPFIDPGIGVATIDAHVRPGEALMGNQLRNLPMHTDYSMLADPPRLTMSLCVTPDPTPGWGALMVTDVEAVCFGVHKDPDVESFCSVALPFANNAKSTADVLESPIISLDSKDQFLVRYHRTRIVRGFEAKGMSANSQQAATMLAFEECVKGYAETLDLQAGDVTIINNRRSVHGRSRCSVEIELSGTTRGRQMQFIFAY